MYSSMRQIIIQNGHAWPILAYQISEGFHKINTNVGSLYKAFRRMGMHSLYHTSLSQESYGVSFVSSLDKLTGRYREYIV